MTNNYAYYRISDNSRNSAISFHLKLKILQNFITIFDKFNVIIIADNCSIELINNIKLLKNEVYYTNLGNTKSFKFCLNLALKKNKDNDIIYFIEDDYYFSKEAQSKLFEGIRYFDYVSLYEHPDKIYSVEYNKLKLSEFTFDQFSENLRLININNEIWRTTSSTTMTFCTKFNIIKSDYKWWYIITGNNSLPLDKRCWIFLTRPFLLPNKKNLLFSLKLLLFNLFSFFFQRKRLLGIPLMKSYSIHLDKSIEIKKFNAYLNEYL